MFLRSLRLRNYRSFLDTGPIELRPIVVLVGANSSGKSSLLRFFPLLRQTFATPTRSPLLWYGDDVDLGDFQSVVFRDAEEPRIIIELQTEHKPVFPESPDFCDIRTELTASGERTTIESVTVQLGSRRTTVRCARDGDVQSIDDGTIWRFPKEQEDGSSLTLESSNELIPVLRAQGVGLLDERQWHFPMGSSIGDDSHVDDGEDLLPLLEEQNRRLRQFSRSIAYIGPFRVAPGRHYRKQEVAVDRITRHGDNLAMFLYALSEPRREEFADWTARYFGFRVRVDREKDHVVLFVEEEERQFPLIDVGYGLSQVLPVIAQCWAAALGESNSERDPAPELLAIEQPELHLHPRHQEKLADMFAGMAQSEIGPRAIIETHSEVMINRFGELVEDGVLDRADISVLLVEKDPDTGVSTVTRSEFDEQGVLTNWPIGFFAP